MNKEKTSSKLQIINPKYYKFKILMSETFS
jgi:hypothetical protein